MKIFRTIVITTTLLALGATTACSSGSSDEPETAAPASAAAPAPEPSESADPALMAATATYLTELGKLDKKLTEDTQVALDNGQEVCIDVQERITDAEQVKTIAFRFSVDEKLAAKILDVTKKNLCLS